MNKLKRVVFGATGREIHIDVPLSNVAIDYRPQQMIADLIAPIVEVPNISGIIPNFDRADVLRVENDIRAPGTEANRVTRSVSSDNFFCINHALQDGVTIEDRWNADPIYVQKLFNGKVRFLTNKLMINWENRVGLQVTSANNVGSSAAVGSAWTDYTNSDPLSDILTAVDNVKDSTTYKPNRIAFSETAWRNFRRNATVLNRIFGTNNGGGFANPGQVANLLDVEQVLIGGALKNTAAEGQSESLSSIWGDHVLVYYAPNAPSVDDPSFMYSFRWAQPGIPNMQVERHPFDTKRKQEDVELGYYQDEKITGSTLGFLVRNVTSST